MIGHFTQVVWNNSVEIGCGVAKGTDNFVYGVCNYSPPGNFIGAQNYQNNVLPLAPQRRRRSVSNVGQVINLNSYGSVFSSSDIVFTYSTSATPEITSASPNSGEGGSITLAGTGFGTNQGKLYDYHGTILFHSISIHNKLFHNLSFHSTLIDNTSFHCIYKFHNKIYLDFTLRNK